ncbi:hypothetical protein EJV47_04050 [Hymenobacter gummosus]|uniref:Uncharacterized protein n=1 Tax=Hymenobacter gummosus TaxID=1776032 RepID=A0A431U6A8_9BACT|nr:hypothetical protein [Hymenobacter gummosus]RTQ52208.1 hypothetical protein EJV47_04050 [Hymenobacter gummosus]
MPLYTALLDYRGGNYVAQVSAPDAHLALQQWAAQLDYQLIPGLDSASWQQLQKRLAEEAPVSLDGVLNVYCQTVTVQGQLALIHLVETVATVTRPAPPPFGAGAGG